MESPKNTKEFKALVEVVKILRGPKGCPWDREQTHESLSKFALEEAFELSEAIDSKSDKDICEELGDVLLQVVLNAQVAKDRNAFDIQDVIQSITEKMIRRHEHVFGDIHLETPDEVKEHWDQLKKNENSAYENPFTNIPVAMPALLRSQKIGQKTIRFRFDWENMEQVFAKVDEELAELKAAFASENRDEIENEMGDLLFTIAQLARHLDMDSEQALRRANKKFESRFTKMREIISADQREITDLTLAELEQYWQKAKKALA